ncbi:MAG: GntR family transcriptional regulator [Candidatus Aminicenantes bacterium]|nr:GntR family transcriptional regulator [Candidatus Aminicenantes bacterium]
MIRINVDLNSPLPAYQQIIQSLKIEVLSGRLKNGDRLPPIRELAKLLKLNPNTVAKAYYTLESEGFVESRPGSGNWVNVRAPGLDGLKRSMLDGETRAYLDRAFSLGAGLDDVRNSVERIAAHE